MRKWHFSSFLMLLVFFFLFTEGMCANEPHGTGQLKKLSKEDIFNELELFADAITIIDANYVEEVKPERMIYGALDGMLSSLDSHSSFLFPEDYKDIQQETRGEFGGVGLRVTMRDDILTVVSPLEGTPADKAGIEPGDKIIKIDGEPSKDLTMDDAIRRLRGTPGTDVRLTILREQESELKEFTIKRAMIKIRSVKEALMIEAALGYIRVTEFQQLTSDDLERALKQLIKKNMRGLILDLRNNPGGLLHSAILVSEKFLTKGNTIVSTKGRIKEQNMIFTSKAFRSYQDFPVVVLVNRGSASGSEIVAGALRDNKRAVLVGEKTFGKGSVQTVIPMRDGSALRLTTSVYLTPSGHIIHNKGIMPDLEVAYKPKDEDARKDLKLEPKGEMLIDLLKGDNQIMEAIGLLKDSQRYKQLLEKADGV